MPVKIIIKKEVSLYSVSVFLETFSILEKYLDFQMLLEYIFDPESDATIFEREVLKNTVPFTTLVLQ